MVMVLKSELDVDLCKMQILKINGACCLVQRVCCVILSVEALAFNELTYMRGAPCVCETPGVNQKG